MPVRFDRFFIAPLNSGLVNNVKPWLIPDDAFSWLNNAYAYRGRIKKRFGSVLMNQGADPAVAQLYSRLRINIGTTNGAGNFGPFVVPGTKFNKGQLFSVETDMFTVFDDTPGPQGMLSTDPAASGTYDVTTGTVTINNSTPLSDVYFYPADPVMGLVTYESTAINDEQYYAFDTQFAYEFNSATKAWERLGTAIWTGSDSQFFWTTNFRGANITDSILFVTNFNIADGIQYWDGIVWATMANLQFNNAGDTIDTARIILPFKDRLIMMNVVESPGGAASIGNRVRFSQNGSPFEANAWNEQIPGRGGYIDAPTKEQIITAQFIKDRLIVYFESSTWELVYTGNQVLPFVWQKINTELGAESTFSQVPFDKVVLGVGNVGIHACNGINVDRIDEKIPFEVFKIHNENDGVNRVYGIRDYYNELVYWTFPSSQNNPTFPNRVLVYNYENRSWAFNDDAITCFGYFQFSATGNSGATWAESTVPWSNATFPWGTPINNVKFLHVIAGNQEGFVFVINNEVPRNAPALQITDITQNSINDVDLTIMNHNLIEDSFIAIESCVGSVELNNLSFQIIEVVDANTVKIDPSVTIGPYLGGGTVARVSKIDIWTKEYGFYLNQFRSTCVPEINFYIDRTDVGQMTVQSYSSSSNAINDTSILPTAPFSNFFPQESTQERLMHTVYIRCEGQTVQYNIFLSDDQLSSLDIAWSDFQMHAMVFSAFPSR